SYAELLDLAADARRELAAIEEGHDPVRAAAAALAAAQAAVDCEHARLAAARRAAAPAFADAVARELEGVGLGDGGFRVGTLRRLAERAQVVTITHLPQIASVADVHFRVEKIPGDPTHTRIEPLADEERRDELERMLGGAEFLATLER